MTRISLALFTVLLFCGSLTSCARLYIDPSAGAETAYLRTLDHAQYFDMEYQRTPREGPLRLSRNSWTFFWLLPVNQPDLGLWLEENLGEETEAANVRAQVYTPWYGHLLFFPTLGLVRVERVEFEAQPVKIRWLRAEEGEPVAPLPPREAEQDEPSPFELDSEIPE